MPNNREQMQALVQDPVLREANRAAKRYAWIDQACITQRPAVVVLQAPEASGLQWQGLVNTLGEHYKVSGPALLFNSGEDEQLRHLQHTLARVLTANESFHLVGQGTSVAAALRLACAEPARILSMTLCDPYLLPARDLLPLAHHLVRAPVRLLALVGESEASSATMAALALTFPGACVLKAANQDELNQEIFHFVSDVQEQSSAPR